MKSKGSNFGGYKMKLFLYLILGVILSYLFILLETIGIIIGIGFAIGLLIILTVNSIEIRREISNFNLKNK